MNSFGLPPFSCLPKSWISRTITCFAVIAIALAFLPGRTLAAIEPSNVLICKSRSPGSISCIQGAKTHVFWHPQTTTLPSRPIGISDIARRLTLAGKLSLNGIGNGLPSIMVGNVGSNEFRNGGNSTYVLGNSIDARITGLPNCTVTSSRDCLAIRTSGVASEKDSVIFGTNTNNAVYIDRKMEETSCLTNLVYWKPDPLPTPTPDPPPPPTGKFVLGATTYGGGILDDLGNWRGTCSIIPIP